MCLIIHKLQDQPLSRDFLEGVAQRNSDGLGFAIIRAGQVPEIHKSLIEAGKVDNAGIIAKILENNDKELAIHFRYKTHGLISTENVHPFEIAPGMFLMHNGIIDAPDGDNVKDSDTARFAYMMLKPILSRVDNPSEYIRTAEFDSMLNCLAGTSNRLLIADKLGVVTNRDSQWSKTGDGVKVSNKNFPVIDANGTKPEPVKSNYNSGGNYRGNGGYTGSYYDRGTFDYGDDYNDGYNGHLFDKPTNTCTPCGNVGNVSGGFLSQKDKDFLKRAGIKESNTEKGAAIDLQKTIVKKSFGDMDKLHEVIELYPELGLDDTFKVVAAALTIPELATLLKDTYYSYLWQYYTATYNEYVQVDIKGDRWLSDKKEPKLLSDITQEESKNDKPSTEEKESA